MDNPGELDVHRLESLISQIRGVAACKVILEGPDALPEIHVLAVPGRSPKEIVRDVESLCLAAFELRIDHRKVSVAMMRDPECPRRVAFKSLSMECAELGLVSTVELAFSRDDQGAWDEEVFSGTAEGPVTAVNQYRLVAEAAVDAVNRYAQSRLGGGVEFMLDDLVLHETRFGTVAVAAVTMIRDFAERPLLGTSFVKRDLNEAVARSVLDAVNRLISAAADLRH